MLNYCLLPSLLPQPVLSFDLQAPVGDVAWAPQSSTVFAAATDSGHVHVFEVAHSRAAAVCVQRVAKMRLTKLAFNARHPVLLVGTERGGVLCLKLSPNLRRSFNPGGELGGGARLPPARCACKHAAAGCQLAPPATPTQSSPALLTAQVPALMWATAGRWHEPTRSAQRLEQQRQRGWRLCWRQQPSATQHFGRRTWRCCDAACCQVALVWVCRKGAPAIAAATAAATSGACRAALPHQTPLLLLTIAASLCLLSVTICGDIGASACSGAVHAVAGCHSLHPASLHGFGLAELPSCQWTASLCTVRAWSRRMACAQVGGVSPGGGGSQPARGQRLHHITPCCPAGRALIFDCFTSPLPSCTIPASLSRLPLCSSQILLQIAKFRPPGALRSLQ